MGEQFVTRSDISGRMVRLGVTDPQEIIIPLLIFPFFYVSWSVRRRVNKACVSRVSVFKKTTRYNR